MDTRDRIHLSIYAGAESGEADDGPLSADVGQLFLHLLLFEKVILTTHRLREFLTIVQKIGVDAASLLLESQRVDLVCAGDAFGTSNRSDDMVHLMHVYPVVENNRGDYISGALQQFYALGLSKRRTPAHTSAQTTRRIVPVHGVESGSPRRAGDRHRDRGVI